MEHPEPDAPPRRAGVVMNPDDLSRILDELGQRLGPTGEHVFALAVRQVYIDAIIGIVGSAIVLVALTAATLVAALVTRRQWAADNARYAAPTDSYAYRSAPDAFPYLMGWMLGALAIAFIGGSAAVMLSSSLSSVLNPEYAALRDILGAIGSAK